MKLNNTLASITVFLFPVHILAVDAQVAADNLCLCFEDSFEAIENLQMNLQNGKSTRNKSKIEKNLDNVMETWNSSIDCFDDLIEKYPDINENEELSKTVWELSNEQCPNPLEKQPN